MTQQSDRNNDQRRKNAFGVRSPIPRFPSIAADHLDLILKGERMKVVLYANGGNAPASRNLKRIIETCVPSNSLEVYGSRHDFAQRIYHIPRNIDIAVLFAQNQDQLSELISLKDFLVDVRIILILPDR